MRSEEGLKTRQPHHMSKPFRVEYINKTNKACKHLFDLDVVFLSFTYKTDFSIQIFLSTSMLYIIIKMVKTPTKRTSKERQNCNICMSRAINCKTVECEHEFCYRCLSKWTRRKGNCPICRQDVRRIHYKNKIIEPQFLKIFDEEKIMLSEQLQIRPNRMLFMPYVYLNHPSTSFASMPQVPRLQYMQPAYFVPIFYGPSS